MRSLRNVWLFLVLYSALLMPSAALAETIRITSGFLEMGSGTSPFDLVGDLRGFRLFGRGYQGGFPANAFVFCEDDECNPGDSARFEHASGGLDLPASATFDGIPHEEVNSLSGTAFAEIGFSSQFVLPAFGSTAVFVAPFTMQGSFSVVGEEAVHTLSGSGMLSSTWRTIGNTWNLESARYEFSAAPVPEPGTLLLGALAGGAAAFCRRRRRAW